MQASYDNTVYNNCSHNFPFSERKTHLYKVHLFSYSFAKHTINVLRIGSVLSSSKLRTNKLTLILCRHDSYSEYYTACSSITSTAQCHTCRSLRLDEAKQDWNKCMYVCVTMSHFLIMFTSESKSTKSSLSSFLKIQLYHSLSCWYLDIDWLIFFMSSLVHKQYPESVHKLLKNERKKIHTFKFTTTCRK